MRTDAMSRSWDDETWERRKRNVVERVAIDDVIGRVVALKGKSGGRSLVGLCPFHAENSPSFTVYPHGGRKVKVGFFVCYGCQAKGDVISFVMRQQGLEFRDAVELLESQNGIDHLKPAPAARKPAVAQVGDRDRLNRSHELMRRSTSLVAGGTVDLYLRQRAIVPPAEYGIGNATLNAGWPPDLRYLERCWHYQERREFPAMIAAIRAHDGTLLTVHQTFLVRDADGAWTKAPVKKAKLVVGSYEPGFIRLGPDADEMVGGEGIESSLSAMQLWKRSGLAFVNSGRMKTVEPPFACRDFIYAADKGGKNGTRWGEIFAHEARRADWNIGRTVAVKIPNLAADKGDFNDLVQLRAAAERRSGVPA